jgi:SAM-dependent methyltransferase
MKPGTNQTQPLVIFNGPEREAAMLVECIKTKASSRGELQILEAGCGNSWQLDLSGVRYVLTGVDMNEAALNIRRYEKRDLHEAVLGDLRTVSLEENKFDVIYNSFVIEHVPNAELVLDNFLRWLNPGGILILRIPDPQSVYGFLSRLTPFWFHVWYKRYIEGRKTAGKPGYDPFPTIYDAVVSREGIRGWCAAHGMNIREEVGWNYPVSRPGLMSHVVTRLIKVFGVLSLGRLSANHVNLTYVMEKPVPVAAIVQTAQDAMQTSAAQ